MHNRPVIHYSRPVSPFWSPEKCQNNAPVTAASMRLYADSKMTGATPLQRSDNVAPPARRILDGQELQHPASGVRNGGTNRYKSSNPQDLSVFKLGSALKCGLIRFTPSEAQIPETVAWQHAKFLAVPLALSVAIC